MALQKQNLNINFGQGLDTKTDPKQVSAGKMIALQNAIFTKGGLLQKRNGYQALPSLPDTTSVSLNTFNGNLTAIGTRLRALSTDSSQWIDMGAIQPVTLNVQAAVRSTHSQRNVDSVIASNGLTCLVWLDGDTNPYYKIMDSVTGQAVVQPTQLPSGCVFPRVFTTGTYFIITFLNTVSGIVHLQRINIPINNPAMPSSTLDVSSQLRNISTGYDGFVFNTNLYLVWSGTGNLIRYTYIDQRAIQHNVRSTGGHTADLMSVTADSSDSAVWITFWDSVSTNGFSMAIDVALNTLLSPTQIITTTAVIALTSTANQSVLSAFYQVSNTYSYSSVRSDFIDKITCTKTGTVGTVVTIARGVGIQSKAFFSQDTSHSYLLASYAGSFQPTYFLMDNNGNVIAKLAYSNGSGYAINQVLPSAVLNGASVQIGYLFKDQIVPVNKAQGVNSNAGIYAQTGINLVNFTINDTPMNSAEIGSALHLAGGILWMYDGVKPVEQNFNLWPEDILTTPSTTGGNLTAQQYFYVFTYEWTDAQGNLYRSAPSIPYGALTTTGTSKVSLDIPTLRLTYKMTPNAVRIVGYRWSAAQQTYYQFTSITSPTLNDPSIDSVTIVDTLADADILGNVILYTTGGVVEDIGPPACSAMTLFKSRLFLVDSEDPNLIWFSKQVIEATPVEMSDLFTIFIAPTVSAQGSTGPITALSALDDKLVIFKKNAIYYLTGTGPDITGANNDFSEPVFITGTVGCTNQKSIVFCPQGLIFESDKGRWLLGRDLSTSYIGSPVEQYNAAVTESAVNVPGTNQVRLTLDNGITLMYDYFYNQWGTFNNIPALSSTIFQGLHTYLNSFGQVFQENLGSYLDGSNPVLMSFTSSWFSLSGLQGFQRAYFFYLLGTYLSPHKLNVQIAYDFDPSIQQSSLIQPNNFSPAYGGDSLYGSSSPYGGPSNLEQWRVFLRRQKCQSFQITVSEIFDPTRGTLAGAGLTLSGINLVVGGKGIYPRIPSTQYAG